MSRVLLDIRAVTAV